MHTLPTLETLSHAEKDELIRALYAQVIELTARVSELTDTFENLKGRLALNSRNSSKPPSSNGFQKPNRNTSTRGKSSKKTGGQTEHTESTLKQSIDPDFLEMHLPPSHCVYGLPLKRTVQS